VFAGLAPCPVAEAMVQVTEAMRRRAGRSAAVMCGRIVNATPAQSPARCMLCYL